MLNHTLMAGISIVFGCNRPVNVMTCPPGAFEVPSRNYQPSNHRHASLYSSRYSQASNIYWQELIFHSHIADAADRTRDTSPGGGLIPAKICFACVGEYQTNSHILGCWRSVDAGNEEYILRLVFLLLLLASPRIGREMKGKSL